MGTDPSGDFRTEDKSDLNNIRSPALLQTCSVGEFILLAEISDFAMSAS